MNSFNDQQIEALKLLQTHLHHKPLKVRANSSTKQRMIAMLNKFPHKNALLESLEEASEVIVGWIWQNKSALYDLVYKVSNKHRIMLSSGFYSDEELFNTLFLESLRVLYNYDFTKKAKPLTYLLGSLKQRKSDLLYLQVPYALGNNAAQGSCTMRGSVLDYRTYTGDYYEEINYQLD